MLEKNQICLLIYQMLPMLKHYNITMKQTLRVLLQTKVLKFLQKKISQRCKRLRKRKAVADEENNTSKESRQDEVIFIKQVPRHPRDRMKQKIYIKTELTRIITPTTDVVFVKQIPQHPKDRMKRKLIKKERNELDKLSFVKQVPSYPKDRMKQKLIKKERNALDKFSFVKQTTSRKIEKKTKNAAR